MVRLAHARTLSTPEICCVIPIAKNSIDLFSGAYILAALLTPSYRGILHHRLDQGFGLQWPCTDVHHPGTPFLHRKKFARGLGSFIPVHYIPPDEQPDGEYPLILTTGRSYFQYQTGTMTRRTETLEREQPECVVEVNVEDAGRLGINNGSRVRVSTRRGDDQLDT